MIGTGLFTSLGYLLVYPFHGFEIAALWIVGGILAIFGSLCYGSLASYIPRSGGEMQFLTTIYGKPFGFSAGVISVVAGFSAPIAAASYAMASYLSQVLLSAHSPALAFVANEKVIKAFAILMIFLIVLVHHRPTKTIERWQNTFVLLKISVIVFLIGAGIWFIYKTPGIPLTEMIPNESRWSLWFGPATALSLLYVAQAYSGWNAAVYIAEEIEDPRRNLPRALIWGTSFVVVVSVAINIVFYFSVPRELLAGKKEVAFLAARNWLGVHGADFVALCIALGLVSAVSSMVWAGSRVIMSWRQWKYPRWGLWLLFGLSSSLILSSSFGFILELMGFSLTLCSALAVLGLFILKRRQAVADVPFHDPLYPFSAIIYVVFCFAILFLGAFASPFGFSTSLGLFLIGWAVATVSEWRRSEITELVAVPTSVSTETP